MFAISFLLLLLPNEGWIESSNAAGLDVLPQAHISQAEVRASVADGDWRDYWQADESHEWGAEVRSLYRVDSRVVLAGEVSYRNFIGQGMSGSLFIDPTDKPFDLEEWNDGHTGEKQLEEYHLRGAASYRLGDRWSIGGGIDFTAANYAKRRDLRHQNRLMHMNLSPGVTWQASAKVRVGANYLFTREVEGVSVNIAGTSDENYYTLVSFGAHYGIKQLATSLDGYVNTSNGSLPLVDRRQGGSLQAEWALADGTCWYGEATVLRRDGYYGRRSNYSVVYTDHEGTEMRLHLLHNCATSATTRHCIGLTVERNKLHNRENLWNEETQSGGLTRITYYGKAQRLERTVTSADVTYRLTTGMADGQPTWTFVADAGYWRRDVRATFYPAYRKQDIGQWHIRSGVERHWTRPNDSFDAALHGTWQWGDGTMADDGTSGSSQATTQATSADRYLQHEFDYLTAQQWLLDASLRYFRPMPRWQITPYVKVDYGRRQATSANYVSEKHHTQISIAVGCDF